MCVSVVSKHKCKLGFMRVMVSMCVRGWRWGVEGRKLD